ncbi:MAG TPA: hypothetical protein VGT03_07305 [Candidatus Acidoferrales bacterium]|nr:hypothetical protein [Candidatus Acidoferrales bacterium]
MTRFCGTLLVLSTASALTFAGVAFAQSGNPSRTPAVRPMAVERVQDSRMIAVSLVKFLNSAEADYKLKEGNFASWTELDSSAYFLAGKSRWAQTEGVPINSGPEIIPGWRLSLVRSADGASYQLMLQNVGDKECMFSFFSDQSGLIYRGQVLDCPAHVVPASN